MGRVEEGGHDSIILSSFTVGFLKKNTEYPYLVARLSRKRMARNHGQFLLHDNPSE